MGPYTFIATTLSAQNLIPMEEMHFTNQKCFLKVRNVYLGNNTISNLVARVERLVVLHKPPWMACGIQDDSCFNQSAVFTCNKWFWWIMVYSLDLHNPHKVMSLMSTCPFPFKVGLYHELTKHATRHTWSQNNLQNDMRKDQKETKHKTRTNTLLNCPFWFTVINNTSWKWKCWNTYTALTGNLLRESIIRNWNAKSGHALLN